MCMCVHVYMFDVIKFGRKHNRLNKSAVSLPYDTHLTNLFISTKIAYDFDAKPPLKLLHA